LLEERRGISDADLRGSVASMCIIYDGYTPVLCRRAE
jgi:hypothetical protein